MLILCRSHLAQPQLNQRPSLRDGPLVDSLPINSANFDHPRIPFILTLYGDSCLILLIPLFPWHCVFGVFFPLRIINCKGGRADRHQCFPFSPPELLANPEPSVIRSLHHLFSFSISSNEYTKGLAVTKAALN